MKIVVIILVILLMLIAIIKIIKVSITPSKTSLTPSTRKRLFKHIQNQIYLDAAGTALYIADSINTQSNLLKTQFMCNPHSGSNCSKLAEANIELARKEVLKFVNAGSFYQVIFTKSATHALNIL